MFGAIALDRFSLVLQLVVDDKIVGPTVARVVNDERRFEVNTFICKAFCVRR
jgi:hypothetical protein